MKLTRYFFVVAVSTALATGLTGCLSQDEFLEEHSYKFDDQTFYQSESDMELALNGCYRQIQSLMMGQTHGSHSWMIGGIGLDTYSQKGGNDHFSNWNTLTSESGYTRHWYDNLFKLINRANTVIDMIEHLPPEVVIHRLTGDGNRNELILPEWSMDKRGVLNEIHKKMKLYESYQGKLLK